MIVLGFLLHGVFFLGCEYLGLAKGYCLSISMNQVLKFFFFCPYVGNVVYLST